MLARRAWTTGEYQQRPESKGARCYSQNLVLRSLCRIPASVLEAKKAEERAPANYKEIASLEEHQDGVRDLCFLPDKQFLVSVSEDSTMKVWSTEKLGERVDCVATIREHAGPIFTAV
jgi:WD40 repeat protein